MLAAKSTTMTTLGLSMEVMRPVCGTSGRSTLTTSEDSVCATGTTWAINMSAGCPTGSVTGPADDFSAWLSTTLTTPSASTAPSL